MLDLDRTYEQRIRPVCGRQRLPHIDADLEAKPIKSIEVSCEIEYEQPRHTARRA